MGGRGGGHHFKTMHAYLLRDYLYVAFVMVPRCTQKTGARASLVTDHCVSARVSLASLSRSGFRGRGAGCASHKNES